MTKINHPLEGVPQPPEVINTTARAFLEALQNPNDPESQKVLDYFSTANVLEKHARRQWSATDLDIANMRKKLEEANQKRAN